MNDFIKEGVKVGDRLFSLTHGYGKVTRLMPEESYCIIVQYEVGYYVDSFTRKGFVTEAHANPILFWDEPKFEIPQKPKREVIKEFDMFVNYDPKQPYQTESFCSEERADYYCSKSDIRVKGKLTFTILE